LVMGSPLGLEGSVVSGVVSSYRVEEGEEYLQLSAPINPGNSGGPVTDVDGTVLGVIVAKYAGFAIEGLAFAVPTDVLCATFDVCS
jgi:serine protease Do